MSAALVRLASAADTVDTAAPHGWVQYKNTELCIDLTCACGVRGHAHGLGVYRVRCASCGRRYVLTAHVTVVQVPDALAVEALAQGEDFVVFGQGRDDE